MLDRWGADRRSCVRLRTAALAAFLAWVPGPWSGVASADEALELKIKAAFLFNFARFAAWPPEKFSGADAPLRICVLEHDALGPVLRESLAGKAIDTHPIAVREVARDGDWQGCHLAWLDNAASESLQPVLRGLEKQAVLSVHEAPAALPDGVIRLYVHDDKLRFEINDAAAQRARLRLSSRLLSLAAVVHVDATP